MLFLEDDWLPLPLSPANVVPPLVDVAADEVPPTSPVRSPQVVPPQLSVVRVPQPPIVPAPYVLHILSVPQTTPPLLAPVAQEVPDAVARGVRRVLVASRSLPLVQALAR